MKIVVSTLVAAPLRDVWCAYTTPDDIKAWNTASPDWHTTSASVDLRPGGGRGLVALGGRLLALGQSGNVVGQRLAHHGDAGRHVERPGRWSGRGPFQPFGMGLGAGIKGDDIFGKHGRRLGEFGHVGADRQVGAIDPAQLVRSQGGRLGAGEDGGAQTGREQDDRDDGPHRYWMDFVREAVLGRSAAAV